MKILTQLSWTLFLAALLVAACEGPEGPVGPQGPTGATGATGATGETGPQGNANVTVGIASIASGDWIQSNPIYYVDISAFFITPDIANNGTVLVFMESTSQTNVWLAMPWIEVVSDSYTSFYLYNYATGSVRVSKQDSDKTQAGNPGVRRFKIIAIAGSGKRDLLEGVDRNNYSAVCAALDIQP